MLKRVIHKWERKLSQRDNHRQIWPFDWGLEYLEPDLIGEENGGGRDSKANSSKDGRLALFELNRRVIAESDSFFQGRPVSDYSFDGHWLTFSSPIRSPYEENNKVHGRYFPAQSRGGSQTSILEDVERADGRAVIVLPQWNGDEDSHVGLCRLINRVGIAALRLSLPYHDRRLIAGHRRAEFMVSANLGRTLQACRQAVLDVRAAIDWLEAQGYRRLAIMGTSIGSCIGFLAYVHDRRLRTGVFNHVSSYFGDVVWEGISTAHVRRGLEAAVTREEVRQSWLAISPNAYINRLAGDMRRGLFISARYDLSFTPELSRLLFEECERHGVRFDVRLVPWGHYTMGQFPFKFYDGYLIVNYLRKNL